MRIVNVRVNGNLRSEMGIIRQHKAEPLKLTPEQVESLRKAIQPSQEDTQASSPPPTITKKVVNVAKAGGRIVSAVVRRQPIMVSEEEKDRRLSICRQCDLWSEGGNIGLGECKHPLCGCTRFKHGLATERCPAGKWLPPPKPQ